MRAIWTQGSSSGGIDPDELTARPQQVLFPYIFGGQGSDEPQAGAIQSLGGQTIWPTNYQQVVSCNGKYMLGDVVVPAVSGLAPENIKKGVIVGGVKGTWEGYVPGATDLYYRGANPAGFAACDLYVNRVEFQSTQITYKRSRITYCLIYSQSKVMLRGYSQLNVQMYVDENSIGHALMYSDTPMKTKEDNRISGENGDTRTGNVTTSFSLTNMQAEKYICLAFCGTNGIIYRIWLS